MSINTFRYSPNPVQLKLHCSSELSTDKPFPGFARIVALNLKSHAPSGPRGTVNQLPDFPPVHTSRTRPGQINTVNSTSSSTTKLRPDFALCPKITSPIKPQNTTGRRRLTDRPNTVCPVITCCIVNIPLPHSPQSRGKQWRTSQFGLCENKQIGIFSHLNHSFDGWHPQPGEEGNRR